MTEQQRRRFSEALSRLGDDESTLMMLAGMVAEDAPEMLAKMNEHAKDDELTEYAKTGHAMKGLLSTFETGEPVSELQPIIDAARVGDRETVLHLHGKLAPQIEILMGEIGDVAQIA